MCHPWTRRYAISYFQRLRETMIQPTKILNEVNVRERKPKKNTENFSKLVKKAYKRLNDQDDDFGTRKMKKLVRSSTREVSKDNWEVTDMEKKKKKGRVSFTEEATSFVYETDPDRPSKTAAVPITVPRSACDNRPGILEPDVNYAIVDFRDREDEVTSKENADPVSMMRSHRPISRRKKNYTSLLRRGVLFSRPTLISMCL